MDVFQVEKWPTKKSNVIKVIVIFVLPIDSNDTRLVYHMRYYQITWFTILKAKLT